MSKKWIKFGGVVFSPDFVVSAYADDNPVVRFEGDGSVTTYPYRVVVERTSSEEWEGYNTREEAEDKLHEILIWLNNGGGNG